MRPPFGVEEFFNIFRDYNYAVWPAQMLLWVLAFIAVLLIHRGRSESSRLISWILALFWAWAAVAYHFKHFASLNRAAWLFGTLFIGQSLLFAYYGGLRGKLRFSLQDGIRGVTGFILILYSLVLYPLAGYIAGHGFIDSPTFGVPCPTTIYTIGIIFFLQRPFPRILLPIPVLWAAIGGSAAVFLGVLQDYGLIIAGAAAIALFASARKRSGMRADTGGAANR
jgi:hypothetical protein